MTYMMFVYRPDWDPSKSGPDRDKDEAAYVEFSSPNPFPVPRVGDEIDREITFKDHGVRKQTPAIVTHVNHAIMDNRPDQPDGELTYMITVKTEERRR